jgi:hypothetical protein
MMEETKELRFSDCKLFQDEETYTTNGSPRKECSRTVWSEATVVDFILDLLSTECQASSAPLKTLLIKYNLNDHSNVLSLLAGIVDALPAEIAMTIDYSLHASSYEAYLKKEVYRLIFVTAIDSEYPFTVPMLKESFYSEVTCPRILCRHVQLREMNSKVLLFRFVCELLLRAPHYSSVRSLYPVNVEHTTAICQWLSENALSKVTLGMGGGYVPAADFVRRDLCTKHATESYISFLSFLDATFRWRVRIRESDMYQLRGTHLCRDKFSTLDLSRNEA